MIPKPYTQFRGVFAGITNMFHLAIFPNNLGQMTIKKPKMVDKCNADLLADFLKSPIV